MDSRKKIAVAMSGGVDSSVAAALLVQAGQEVIGVTLDLFSLPKEYCREQDHLSCCGREAAYQAQQVARHLGVEHYLVDMKSIFEKGVIEDFCFEYAAGRTPNPCIRCNEYIKFDAFLRVARKLHAHRIATGHHARVVHDTDRDRFLLLRGKDPDKDQSYFLYRSTQAQLAASRFPVGDFAKTEVRELARKYGLPTAARPESQEICFIPNNDTKSFLFQRMPELVQPGPIVDEKGTELGTHPGIMFFTVGQRRGIGLSAPDPLYVLEVRAKDRTIVVGPNKALYKRAFMASRLNWIAIPELKRPLKVQTRIRYKHKEAAATVVPLPGEKVSVEFERPQRALTPGQSAVFYDGDVVLGGGIIEASLD